MYGVCVRARARALGSFHLIHKTISPQILILLKKVFLYREHKDDFLC